jgi:hypothetical protein
MMPRGWGYVNYGGSRARVLERGGGHVSIEEPLQKIRGLLTTCLPPLGIGR